MNFNYRKKSKRKKKLIPDGLKKSQLMKFTYEVDKLTILIDFILINKF
jgi:hypothetical protein